MKLPTLKKVIVEHLSLYTRTINMRLSPGINLIIGGNGIGKTTLVNTILYALVGNATYEKPDAKAGKSLLIAEDYFQGRLDIKDHDRAKVTLILGIDKDEIIIARALYHPSILEVVVKQHGKADQELKGTPDQLEAKYQQMMQKMLDMNKFEDFVFLVSNLLLFDEERRILAWDSETQNRIIRLLFVSKEFDDEFTKYSTLVTRNDTQGRHKSEERKDIRRAIDQWMKDKAETKNEETLAPESPEAELQKLEFRLAEMQKNLDVVIDEIEHLKDLLDSEVIRLKELNAEADRIELQRAPLANQLTELENKFYSNVYQNVPPEYVMILEGLIKQGACQFCGTKDSSLKDTGRKLKRTGQCIVCRSPVQIKYDGTDDQGEAGLVEQINVFREHLDQLDSAQAECAKAQSAMKNEIRRIQNTISEKSREHRRLETEILETSSKYITSTGNEPFSDPDKDLWLEKQNTRIKKLTSEIDKLYRKRDEASEKLEELNEEVLNALYDVNERLTPLFSHFASRFLGTSCELVVTNRTKAKKPVAYMFPRFYGKERAYINQVSESQRFFIDQAFRMALITWFSESTGQSTFCIVETPEGSLDLAYERNVADMYAEFANYGHTIIATSNLNSSNFLGGLFNQLNDGKNKKGSVLDLLQYGQLTSVQRKHAKEFNIRLKQLDLPLIQLD
jgi:DNA repair exonuclease SbcCD ATPase subunit